LGMLLLKPQLPKKTKLQDDSECLTQIGSDDSLTIYTTDFYSNLGRSIAIADFNNDSLDDVIIGAPGYSPEGSPRAGAVYVIYGRKDISGHEKLVVGAGENETSTSIYGDVTNGRLGWSVGSVDFNTDGFLDLVITMPGSSAELLEYFGQVQIYFGSEKGLSSKPDIIIQSTESFTNLAHSITTGDVDGDGHADLLIGAPFGKQNASGVNFECGEVWIFFSSHHRKQGQILFKNESNIQLNGLQPWDWFGFHMEVIENDAFGNSYLLVGAPNHPVGNYTVGKLYAFDLNEVGKTYKKLNYKGYNLPLKWSITGVDVHGHLGYSFAVGYPLENNTSTFVALGIPTKTIAAEHWYEEDKPQAGTVIVFSMSKLSGAYTISQIDALTTLVSDQSFSHLGMVVGFSPITNENGAQTLFVGEPYFDPSIFPSEADSGAAYLWKGGDVFPHGVTTNMQSSSSVCIQSTIGKSLTGYGGAMLDFNGDGIEDLVTTSPRDGTIVEYGGTVNIIIDVFNWM